MRAVPYGSETTRQRDWPGPCWDCGVADGGEHEPGCFLEQCPRCGGQAIDGCLPWPRPLWRLIRWTLEHRR
jgi:hypothetical protein